MMPWIVNFLFTRKILPKNKMTTQPAFSVFYKFQRKKDGQFHYACLNFWTLSNVLLFLSTICMCILIFIVLIYIQDILAKGYHMNPIAFYNRFYMTKQEMYYCSWMTIFAFVVMSYIFILIVYEGLVLRWQDKLWNRDRQQIDPYQTDGIVESLIKWCLITVGVAAMIFGVILLHGNRTTQKASPNPGDIIVCCIIIAVLCCYIFWILYKIPKRSQSGEALLRTNQSATVHESKRQTKLKDQPTRRLHWGTVEQIKNPKYKIITRKM
jgi:hypothetical protein